MHHFIAIVQLRKKLFTICGQRGCPLYWNPNDLGSSRHLNGPSSQSGPSDSNDPIVPVSCSDPDDSSSPRNPTDQSGHNGSIGLTGPNGHGSTNSFSELNGLVVLKIPVIQMVIMALLVPLIHMVLEVPVIKMSQLPWSLSDPDGPSVPKSSSGPNDLSGS